MSQGWVIVLAVGTATIAIKAAGPVLLGGRQLPAPVLSIVALLPAALLAALVAVLTFQADGALVVDARLIGVVVGAVAIWRRVPTLLVVILASAGWGSASSEPSPPGRGCDSADGRRSRPGRSPAARPARSSH